MKLTNQQKILIVILGVAFVYIFYQYLWRPIGKKTEVLEKKIAEQKGKLQLARASAQELERIRKEIESLITGLKEVESRLPKKKEIPSLIRSLTRMAEKHQVSISNLSPQVPVIRDYLLEMSFNVQAVGNYHGLAAFLTSLAQGGRIINTTNLRMAGQSKSEDKTVSTSFNITTYVFREGS